MQKAKMLYESGMELLKINPKKASAFFIKAWKRYLALKAFDNVYETIDRLVEIYHGSLRKPDAALTYLEQKHDLKNKFKDFSGAIMASIELARMFAEYPKGKDEALTFYKRAWKENVKYAVGGEYDEIIPNEVTEILKSIGKDEVFIQKYLAESFTK